MAGSRRLRRTLSALAVCGLLDASASARDSRVAAIDAQVASLRVAAEASPRVDVDFPGGAEGGTATIFLDASQRPMWTDLWDYGHSGKGHVACALSATGELLAIAHEEHVYNAPNYARPELAAELRADGAGKVEAFDEMKTKVFVERYYYTGDPAPIREADGNPGRTPGFLWNDATALAALCRAALVQVPAARPPAPSARLSPPADPPPPR